jgi:hypothetical protein
MVGLFTRFGGLAMGMPVYDHEVKSCSLPMYFDIDEVVRLAAIPKVHSR